MYFFEPMIRRVLEKVKCGKHAREIGKGNYYRVVNRAWKGSSPGNTRKNAPKREMCVIGKVKGKTR